MVILPVNMDHLRAFILWVVVAL